MFLKKRIQTFEPFNFTIEQTNDSTISVEIGAGVNSNSFKVIEALIEFFPLRDFLTLPLTSSDKKVDNVYEQEKSLCSALKFKILSTPEKEGVQLTKDTLTFSAYKDSYDFKGPIAKDLIPVGGLYSPELPLEKMGQQVLQPYIEKSKICWKLSCLRTWIEKGYFKDDVVLNKSHDTINLLKIDEVVKINPLDWIRSKGLTLKESKSQKVYSSFDVQNYQNSTNQLKVFFKEDDND